MSAPANRRLSLERLEDRTLLSGLNQLVVMSENLYMGADPTPVILAQLSGVPALSIPAVTQFWNDVQKTNFNERADAIAQQIVSDKPDLVGLQEVMKYWTGPADSLWGLSNKANKIELDFLQVLTSKLTAKGVPYTPIAVTALGDFEAPGFVNGQLRDLRLVDQVAILARSDLLSSQIQVSNVQGGAFGATLVLPTLTGGTVEIHRGWNSVDVATGTTKFRFINMVLETPPFPMIQAIQGAELLIGPAFTSMPVVLVGDSNSDGSVPNSSNSHTYNLLVGSGFKDAWSTANPGNPGYTWGNDPDLRNTNAMSYQIFLQGPFRMDLIMSRGPFQASSMKRVGVLPTERTATGMWPSDHAGIVAKLKLTNQSVTTLEMPEGVSGLACSRYTVGDWFTQDDAHTSFSSINTTSWPMTEEWRLEMSPCQDGVTGMTTFVTTSAGDGHSQDLDRPQNEGS